MERGNYPYSSIKFGKYYETADNCRDNGVGDYSRGSSLRNDSRKTLERY